MIGRADARRRRERRRAAATAVCDAAQATPRAANRSRLIAPGARRPVDHHHRAGLAGRLRRPHVVDHDHVATARDAARTRRRARPVPRTAARDADARGTPRPRRPRPRRHAARSSISQRPRPHVLPDSESERLRTPPPRRSRAAPAARRRYGTDWSRRRSVAMAVGRGDPIARNVPCNCTADIARSPATPSVAARCTRRLRHVHVPPTCDRSRSPAPSNCTERSVQLARAPAPVVPPEPRTAKRAP